MELCSLNRQDVNYHFPLMQQMIEIGKGGHRKVESYRLSHHPHHPQKRDWIGLACWLFVSIVVGLLALPVMVGREIYQYQYRRYHLSRFEWEDVVRYTLVILLGSIIHYLV